MTPHVLINSMPTNRWCGYQDYTSGGRHGCDPGYGLDGPLSTAGARVHRAHLRNVSPPRHRMGALPVQADGDQSGLHDRPVAAGACGQALDDLRTVLLSGPMGVAPGEPSVAGAGDWAADRIGGRRTSGPP